MRPDASHDGTAFYTHQLRAAQRSGYLNPGLAAGPVVFGLMGGGPVGAVAAAVAAGDGSAIWKGLQSAVDWARSPDSPFAWQPPPATTTTPVAVVARRAGAAAGL
ncbi:MAG: hypothetical protein M1826_000686, partial [Phylliscum demangeonii]